ncbi:glycosyltransferase family 2 protein [uncultured Bacteroides sp.]|uniref:glycosyltransferase family 2 protein n=1 Tax=uncultured Bacteroides sp. TaxID=162156 RepID=UPI00261C1CA1|nr:glycosyltransferase family 2 protein [uncultured Bacteroides sp.]
MSSNLAIVIPAYKDVFLSQTLDSLCNQSCKDFTLYIGDDCSPYDIKSIVDQYNEKLNVKYHRFNNNLGGTDLVAHWERCIDLTDKEEWLWLFSDDDIIGSKCVELFYKYQKKYSFDVYHFDIKEINELGIETGITSNYMDVTTSFYLHKKKMQGKLISMVVENIFSRAIYNQCGGFQHFDLAWGSDTATWIKFIYQKGLKKIPGDYIYWRKSSQNITPSLDVNIVDRKVNSLMKYIEWTYSFFINVSPIQLFWVNSYGYLLRIRRFVCYASKSVIDNSISQFVRIHKVKLLKPVFKVLIPIIARKNK